MVLPDYLSDLLQSGAREIGRGGVAGVVASWTATGGQSEPCPLPPPCPPGPACPNLTCPELTCPEAVCPACPALICPEGPPWALLAAAVVFNVVVAAVGGFCAGLMPGSRILVRYVDAGEDLLHERVCLWPVSFEEWITESPDGDQMPERLSGPDVEEFIVLAPGGGVPRHVASPRYRFRREIGARELRVKVIEARHLARQALAAGEAPLPAPLHTQQWDGSVLALEDFWRLGGAPARRGRGKAPPIVLDAPDDEDDDKGGTQTPPPREEAVAAEATATVEDEKDYRWVVGEPNSSFPLGTEFTVATILAERDACRLGDRMLVSVAATPASGRTAEGVVVLYRLHVDDVPGFGARRWKDIAALMPRDGSAAPEPPLPAPVDAPPELDLDDARTLSVQYDEQGERFRSWKEAVAKMHESFYEDWPVEGPRTMLWMAKNIERTGGSPMQWYHKYLVENRIAASDRLAYELQAMCRLLEHAGCYDQLNLASLAAFEVLARRMQLLLDAASRGPGEGRFEDEELWSGHSQRTAGIAPALTAHVATRTKEKAEIEKQRQKAITRRANDAISTLNWLSGCGGAAPEGICSPAQAEAVQHIKGVMERSQAVDAVPRPHEAARALLRSRAGYDSDEHIVSDYQEELLSVPASCKDCPYAVDVVPAEAASMLVDFEERMVRPDIEFWELEDNSEPVTPYMDRNLSGDRQAYIKFVRRLESIGVLRWCAAVKERATVFCVKKKSGMQRLVVDARRSNRRFRDPPGVELATAESLGLIEVDDDVEVFISTGDVRDAFYRFKIDVELSRYFGLPPLRAEELHLHEAEGEWLSPDRWVHPCFAVLPMGFKWSLYLVQEAVTKQVEDATGATADRRLQTFGGSRLITSGGQPLHYVYVGNVGFLGGQPEEVQTMKDCACERLDGVGLSTHEHIEAQTQSEVLGVAIDGGRGIVATSLKRMWKVDSLLTWLLDRGVASGHQLESTVGHLTFISMLRRPLLSVLSATYQFIRSAGGEQVDLWPSVRAELSAARALLPFAFAQWRLPWHGEVVATDACPT
ncbi:unnamed protein product, partial [Prorocentrum cordatum]